MCLNWIYLLTLVHVFWISATRDLPVCTEGDYYFQYTECDSSGSRWRVAIPQRPGECRGLPDPVQGPDCTFSCGAGQFLEMSTQKCTPCAAGSFSLGSAIRFDEWNDLPPGFSSLVTSFNKSPPGQERRNCNGSSWKPRGSYVESNRDECTVSLVYAVHLKKPGSVSFDYQYEDNNIFFEFSIQNNQCQEMERTSDEKWIKMTTNGEWSRHTVSLKSGPNVLYWRSTRVTVGVNVVKAVLLKNIQIEGVAYMSACLPCEAGTFSNDPGSSSCISCPRNTYSGRGATTCTPCDAVTHYALEGSSSCKPRPACSPKDYFQIHSVCDQKGETQVIYKWIEPKICLEDAPDAVRLPPSAEREPCPPCNPGFYNNNTAVCSPCPQGTYSNGLTECRSCPAGSEPVMGYEFRWWNFLPTNMKSSCFNVANTKCDGMNGWEAAGDYVRSGAGGSDNDYLILKLKVPGFRLPTSVSETSTTEYGSITFVFETICTADCEFYFMMDTDRRSTSVVESWEGRMEKQSFTHFMTKNASVAFTWAFQRTNQAKDTRPYINDMAKIFSITVTNALDGVAWECKACALQSQESGSACVPCPTGYYINTETNQCQECPLNTYLSGHHIYGRAACQPCGPSSRGNKEHSLCYSDCSFTYKDKNRTFKYDFSPLGSTGSITSGPSFTSKGTKYYHLFNISLCGTKSYRAAFCSDNVTELADKGPHSEANSVEAFICQSTIIPSDGQGFKTAVASQSISLADRFLGATAEKSLGGVNTRPELFSVRTKTLPDVNFFYRSSQVTPSCQNGRNTVLTLRCHPEGTAIGAITVPRACPAGTCDGCTFYFLWESSSACPHCTEEDYHHIEGVCKGGTQETVYLWKEPRLCTGGVALPGRRRESCERIDFWLKVGGLVGLCVAALLVVLTCHFWKNNRRLAYKYSRLVMSASKECELPGVDSCAIMEEEGEEMQGAAVYFKPSLLHRITPQFCISHCTRCSHADVK